MDLDQLLRRARREAGLTQAELARRAGTSQSAVSAYESGAKQPAPATLERLLAAAGVALRLSLVERPPADLSGPRGHLLRERLRRVRRVLRERGATDARVFGSVARGQDHEDSDVDLLVELPPDATLLDHAGLVADLREALGVEVDVVTPGALAAARDPEMVARIREEAVPL